MDQILMELGLSSYAETLRYNNYNIRYFKDLLQSNGNA